MFCNSSNALADLTLAFMTFPGVEYLGFEILGLIFAALAAMFPVAKGIVLGFLTSAGLSDVFPIPLLAPFAPIGASVTLSVALFVLVGTRSDPVVGIAAMMPVFDLGSMNKTHLLRLDMAQPFGFLIGWRNLSNE
uniref:Uncharacterized protein n=1 Tax=Glossina pallidipes TaxID=7398 RepID=A0A1A9ZXF5_GLOPL